MLFRSQKDHGRWQEHRDGRTRRERLNPPIRNRGEVIGGECSQLGRQLSTPRAFQLIRMQLDGQSMSRGGGENLAGLAGADRKSTR